MPGAGEPDYVCVGSRRGACAVASGADAVVLDLWLDSDTVQRGTPGWQLMLLYANQERLDDDSLVRYAKKLNLDPRRFRKELGSGVHAPRVRSDYLGGLRSGVKGTPTMFINGESYMGKLDLTALVGTLLTVARRTAR